MPNRSNEQQGYRVLLIGLDGATLDFIAPWVNAGELPTFKKIMEKGVYGTLASTVPPVTPPAWTSLYTGTNPGKHGIFHFFDFQSLPSRKLLVNSTYRKSPTFWEVLSEAGKRCVLINIPVAYPPQPLNGIMVTGFMTPPETDNFTYPPKLGEELIRRGYEVAQVFSQQRRPSASAIRQQIDMRTIAAKWLMEAQDWDLFMVVYMATDVVVHRFPENEEMIKYVYKLLDESIKQLMATAPSNTITILVSDHGIRTVRKQLMLNNLLLRRGFIRFKYARKQARRSPTPKRFMRSIIATIGQANIARRILRKLPFSFRRRFITQVVPKLSDIDLESTMAWGAASAHGNYVFLQLGKAARAEEAVMREIRRRLQQELSQLVDPETGKRITCRLHDSSEFIWGPYTPEAPPFVLEVEEDYEVAVDFTYDRAVVHHTPQPVSAHAMNGIFMAVGPAVGSRTPKKFKAAIWDVMPTVLHILNVPPPPGLDGRVLREIFMPDSDLARRELKLAPWLAGAVGNLLRRNGKKSWNASPT